MMDENDRRRTGQRRRRRSRRSKRQDKNRTRNAYEAWEEEERPQPRRQAQALPEVFIYTHTIYKAGD